MIGTLLVDDVPPCATDIVDTEFALVVEETDCAAWGAARAGNGAMSLDNVKTLVPMSNNATMSWGIARRRTECRIRNNSLSNTRCTEKIIIHFHEYNDIVKYRVFSRSLSKDYTIIAIILPAITPVQ